jgi:hypothetical protein
VSGGYDNKIVRGPADLIEAAFVGNNLSIARLTPTIASVFNIFGGSSYYLNGFEIQIGAGTTGVNNTVQLLEGPNPGDLIGAIQLYAGSSGLSATGPANTVSLYVSPSMLNYRNRSGANRYLHFNYPGSITAGNITCLLNGGPTTLVS